MCGNHSVLSDSLWLHGLEPTRLLCPWNSPGKNIAVGCHALLQVIFPTSDQTQVYCHADRFLTIWAILEAMPVLDMYPQKIIIQKDTSPQCSCSTNYTARHGSNVNVHRQMNGWRRLCKRPSTDEWMKKIMWYMNAVQYSVQFNHSVMSDSLWPHEPQHARPPCPPPTPGIHSNPCPSSRWCHPAISSSVVPFSSCPQSLPASRSFPMSQLFIWGGQSIGVSASTSVLLMNTQDWFLLGWTGWISVQSKALSRVFSNTTVQKHQFFCTQLSL